MRCPGALWPVLHLRERARRWWFLRRANAAYARLRSDPEEWAEELEERRFWDAVVASRPGAQGG